MSSPPNHALPPETPPSSGRARDGARLRRPGHARRVDPPATMRAAVPHDRIDYVDAYRAPPISGRHSAEAWLRTTFDDAPRSVMYVARTLWKLFDAELAPDPSPGHIFGCRLTVHDDDSATMAVVWGIGLRATIVAQTGIARPGEESATVVATFVRLETAASRRVWRLAAPVHRSLMAVGLSLAAWRLDRADPA